MTIEEVSTYNEAVSRFLAAATWLDDADLPGVMVLKSLAAQLDTAIGDGKAPQAALVSQFGQTFRDLRGRAPKADGAGADPLAKELAAAGQQGIDLFTAHAEAWAAEHGDD